MNRRLRISEGLAGWRTLWLVATVRLKNLTKQFDGVTAVDGVDLDIADREFMILLGPSGCGKSTLLRMIAGLEDPTEGEVFIGDVKVNDVLPKERDVAMVFQSYALYPHKTVQANIEFPLKVRGIDKAARAKAATAAAESLGLGDYMLRKPGALSGGQRQRVALARAIVRNPAVFCMDEPLSNLDAKLRGETRAELIALHQRLSSTFIYVTHDQVEAMTMGSRIAVMQRGKIEQIGTPQEVYDRPASVFIAQFVGTPPMNILPAGSIETGDHLVGVRPEHIHIAPDGPLAMTVALVEQLGHELLVTGTVGDRRVIVRQAAHSVVPDIGAEVRLVVDEADRHRFDPVTERRIDA
ncbi:MAG: carbohydrate transporter ATP-binding protein family [Ilumatobacteraceae bacterium]|nr:carbohydrate transporter ATP-binding protein family [Ilumatobacteraceae bacterium]